MINEAVFKLKTLFNPNDVLSRWVLKLAMVRNDLLYVHNRLLDFYENDRLPVTGERLYFFRLAASHYRETAKLIDDHKNTDTIRKFISKLDSKSLSNYNQILESCTPWETSFLKKIVKPIRDNSFHYGQDHFEDELHRIDDFYTRFISTGKKRKEVDLVFADEVSLNIILGHFSEDELKEVITKLATYISSLISFVDSAVGYYLLIKKDRISFFIRTLK